MMTTSNDCHEYLTPSLDTASNIPLHVNVHNTKITDSVHAGQAQVHYWSHWVQAYHWSHSGYSAIIGHMSIPFPDQDEGPLVLWPYVT